MEIFTYMMMGGSTDQITVMLLASTPDGQQELVDTFKGFSESAKNSIRQQLGALPYFHRRRHRYRRRRRHDPTTAATTTRTQTHATPSASCRSTQTAFYQR